MLKGHIQQIFLESLLEICQALLQVLGHSSDKWGHSLSSHVGLLPIDSDS